MASLATPSELTMQVRTSARAGSRLVSMRFIGRTRTNGATQFGAEFFGDGVRFHAVANDLGADEDDQFGTHFRIVLIRKGIAYALNLIEQWNAAFVLVLLILDQSGQQHRLAVGDRNRALDLPLLDGRVQGVGRAAGQDVADLLLDIESYFAIGADTGRNVQDDAGVTIIDGVDDRIAARGCRIENACRAGRDRNLVADLKRGRLVVDHDHGRGGPHLHAGDRA